jgi:hypothetical protein
MQDASEMQSTVTDLLNHHHVSLLDLAHTADVEPGAVAALVAGFSIDEELAELLLQGLAELIDDEKNTG